MASLNHGIMYTHTGLRFFNISRFFATRPIKLNRPVSPTVSDNIVIAPKPQPTVTKPAATPKKVCCCARRS